MHPHSFLLESVEGGERIGRYTFFGVDPFQIVSCRGERIAVSRGESATPVSNRRSGSRRPPVQEETGNVFEFLRALGGRYQSVEIPGLPPFTAGAVGYLSYEAVRMLERLPPRVAADVDLDDAVFMYFSNLLAFDHVQHRLFLIANVLTEEGKGSLRAKYDAACRHLDQLEEPPAPPAATTENAAARRRLARTREHDASSV